jgi:peptide/nickel transport system permease protein
MSQRLLSKMGIIRYVISRLIIAIPLVIIAICINFTIIHLAPGSPIDFILSSGEVHLITPDYLAAIQAQYGLDKPLWEQLFIYVSKILRGDLGYSYLYSEPVIRLIQEKLANTLFLVVPAFFVALGLGLVTGIKSSEKVYSLGDNINTILALVFWAMPSFWFSMILIMVFAVDLHWLPAQSISDIGATGFNYIISMLTHLILPTIVLGIGEYASYTRYIRSSMLQILKKDYITTAWAKGCTSNLVYYKHAFRNAILPVVTIVALRIGGLFMGSVLVETVFSYPGMGMLLFSSISKRDYNTIQGIFLVYTIITILFTLIADITYAYLDPRIRYGD